MNVMANAHHLTRVMVAAKAVGTYAELFRKALKRAHRDLKALAKMAAKFMVERFVKPGEYVTVDIRTLPTFQASKGITGTVEHWNIKGTYKGEQRYTEGAAGFSEKTLARHLEHWAGATWRGYTDLCLMLEIDGKLYRLIK